MNKTEKIISLLLGAALAWYLFVELPKENKARDARYREAAVAAEKAKAEAAAANGAAKVETAAKPAPVAPAQKKPEQAAAKPDKPEKTLLLENDDLKIELSTWGGVVKKATMKKYAVREGAVDEKDNPPVEFDFSHSPLGELKADPLAAPVAYDVAETTSNSVVFAAADGSRRTVTLGANYLVEVRDTASSLANSRMSLSIGSMAMGSGSDDLLSVDSWALDGKGGRVIHHCEGDSPLKGYLVGGISGGCGGSRSAARLPAAANESVAGPQKWIALKNRFFVTALVGVSAADGGAQIAAEGFSACISRDVSAQAYRPNEVSAKTLVVFPGDMKSVFYLGPKKQSLLWDLGMKDVMEFGMWRVICYPLVSILNFFHSFIPNYGIAIILLTILVRLVFWPLSHKSTVGMKKMQEIQPKIKELQEKHKGNPQRLQQEMMALYRENKVNPLSSCLPMLAQIPVFIALFNVLRSAVELRYASFLWIGDLSAPEGLGAGSWFPWFGGLNILPILMAATMGLQSALTPGTGDKQQKRMMTVFMPVMMLFMFYKFASALSLYWTLSQVISIVQMWLIRRSTAAEKSGAIMPDEVIDPPATRQMRRHSN